jgi:peptidoglycan/LPS O-acetylase OafA/YrhL
MESRVGIYRPELDGIRALAAIAVVAFHINRFAPGFLGVDVFFVLSGYLITKLLRKAFAAGESLSRFYQRRFFRLFPILLVNVLVVSTIVYFISHQFDVEYALRAVLYLRNFFTSVNNEADLWTHTWSLASEQQYYLIFPLILRFLVRRVLNFNKISLLFVASFSILQFLNQIHFSHGSPILLDVLIRCSGLWLGCSLGIL